MFSLVPTYLSLLAAIFVSASPISLPDNLPAWAKRAGAPVDDVEISVFPAGNLTTCGAINVTWSFPSEAQEPYTLLIGSGGQYVGLTPLYYVSNITNATSYNWTINQQAGTDLYFQVFDKNNLTEYIQGPTLLVHENPYSNITETFSNGTIVCGL